MHSGVNESESLSNFTANPAPIVEKLHRSGEPILLTADGQGDLIVQDAASYERILDQMERLESIAGIKEGLKDLAAGRSRPMREVLQDLG